MVATYPGTTLDDGLNEWQMVMRSMNRSPETIRTYSTSVAQLAAHTDATIDHVTPAHIRSYLTEVLDTKSASTAVTRWGGLLAFFKWSAGEGFCDPDPMQKVTRPAKDERVVDILTDDQVRALLATCKGATFAAMRDNAILRTYLTTGMRLSECATITLDNLDLRNQVVRIVGKGRREREVRLIDPTALALQRYMRVRKNHPKADTPMLWVGKLGPLTSAGIKQLIQRRGVQAGVPVHAHLFRHRFAHEWLASGGTEGGLMGTAGWRSRQMLDRYAKSAAGERSRAEHARLNVGGDF